MSARARAREACWICGATNALGGFGIDEHDDRSREPHLGRARARPGRAHTSGVRVCARVPPTVSQSVMKMPLRLYSPGTGMLNLMGVFGKINLFVRTVAGLFPLKRRYSR